jgi:hypothetical protein
VAGVRSRVWLVGAAIAVAGTGCGVLPQPSDPLDALNAWPPSATIGEDGSVITATYQAWPLDGGPRAFACARPPAGVFGASPDELIIATDPSCVPFEVRQNGRQIQLRLDRQGLPAVFDGLESWTVVLAVAFNDSSWVASSTLPVVFPPLRPTSIQTDPGPS